MSKIKSILLGFILIAFSTVAFAQKSYPRVTYDFSGVKLDVASDVEWKDYVNWDIAYFSHVKGAPYPGWSGKPIQELVIAPFIDHNIMDGTELAVLNVGVTPDAAHHFIPAVSPASCKVLMHENDILYVSGILHIPGKGKAPYFENLNCKLN